VNPEIEKMVRKGDMIGAIVTILSREIGWDVPNKRRLEAAKQIIEIFKLKE
jgi:hypothetical protein